MTQPPKDTAKPELYWISGSPPCWRVMLALEAKGITYESQRLDAAKEEHKTDAYLAINARGQVPTLRLGAVTVRESVAILAFIEAQWPQPALFGRTAAQTAEVWQSIMDFESNTRPAVAAIAQILFRHQQAARREELEACTTAAGAELERYDAALKRAAYLCGPELTAADFVLYPAIRWLERALDKAPEGRSTVAGLSGMLEGRVGIGAWRRRIEALPYFEPTVPPHWRA